MYLSSTSEGRRQLGSNSRDVTPVSWEERGGWTRRVSRHVSVSATGRPFQAQRMNCQAKAGNLQSAIKVLEDSVCGGAWSAEHRALCFGLRSRNHSRGCQYQCDLGAVEQLCTLVVEVVAGRQPAHGLVLVVKAGHDLPKLITGGDIRGKARVLFVGALVNADLEEGGGRAESRQLDSCPAWEISHCGLTRGG